MFPHLCRLIISEVVARKTKKPMDKPKKSGQSVLGNKTEVSRGESFFQMGFSVCLHDFIK